MNPFNKPPQTPQCETEEDASQIWDLLNDKMYEWSKGEVEKVEMDWLS